MKIYAHPWSINSRKTLTTLAEKDLTAELALVMIPWGEQKKPEHLALHPFGKVPVLDDDGFILYETRAINAYLDAKSSATPLMPKDARAAARVEQWIDIATAYLLPHAHALVFEAVFRRHVGGDPNRAAMEAARSALGLPLDQLTRALESRAFVGGAALTRADIHWMPYIEYLFQAGEKALLQDRSALLAWWERVSARPSWQKVARTGPQPYDPTITADVIARLHRG